MKPSETLPPLIPAPTTWRPAGGVYSLADLSRIMVRDGGRELFALAEQTAAGLAPALARNLPVLVADAGNPPVGSLLFRQAAGLAPEQYELRITGEGIEIAATYPAGFHHGVTTLIQLVINGRTGGKPATLPCCVIHDQPRFAWRGMMLDCGRRFMSVEFIKGLLDKLALYKFNVLHWHLTEDQGWRLVVPGYPRLTEIGASRTEVDGSIHGGFYTAADVREVVEYAAERFITIVPEVEMPGHCLAALAAYPELSCTGGPFSVQTQWGVHEDVLCPGREETFQFLEDVLTHVMALFPGRYIHIGGDEVPKGRWRECEHCQARIRNEGLADESALQGWFTARIGNFLADHGRRLIAWDEIMTSIAASGKGAPARIAVQAWKGLDEAATAAKAGYDVVVSPTTHTYFDYDPGVLDLQQVYHFRPVPPDLDEAAARRILGGQVNLWTEYIPPERVDAMLFPRLTALAEALWTGAKERDFASFLDRLHDHGSVLNHLGVRPGVAARPVIISGRFDSVRGIHRLDITLDPRVGAALAGRDLAVRYLILESPLPPSFHPGFLPEDQGLPTITVADDTAPEILEIPSAARTGVSWLVQARLFVDDRPYGAPALLEISGHTAVGANIVLVHEPGERYTGGRSGGLVDGLHGSRFFQDGLWTGFEGEDLDATLDLDRLQCLDGVSVRFLQDVNAWIILPREVRFSVSSEGIHWRDAGTISHEVSDKIQDKLVHEFAVNLDGCAVRFVRVHGISPAVCPDWHPGRGKSCWLCADEIVCR